MKNIINEGKDKSKKEFANNFVYRIHCNNCPATYVGQTKRKLMTRINEHKTSEGSATIIHEIETGHKFNFINYNILDKEENLNKRLISEMLHMHLQKQPVNKKEDTQNLNHIYTHLL